MSSPVARASILVTACLGGVVAIMTSAPGCSGDDDAAVADAAVEAAPPDANRPAKPESDAAPPTCREECEAAHPAGLAKDEAINTCWQSYCKLPCVHEVPGDGGVAADGAAPDGGTCAAPVVTVSVECDECTNTFCCESWDGCFQDAECTALNACYQDCAD